MPEPDLTRSPSQRLCEKMGWDADIAAPAFSASRGNNKDEHAINILNNASDKAAVEPLSSAEPIPTQHAQNTRSDTHIKTAEHTSTKGDGKHVTVECITPVVTEVSQDNRPIARPGAYAIPGTNSISTDSASPPGRGASISHSYVYAETPHGDITNNQNSPADALAAFCVDEVAANDILVESDLDGSKDTSSLLRTERRYRYCITIGAAASILAILAFVILGATGAFSGASTSSSNNVKYGSIDGTSTCSSEGQMNTTDAPEATFEGVAYKIGSLFGTRLGVSLAMQGKRLAVGTLEAADTHALAVYDLNDSQAVQVGQIIPGVVSGVKGDVRAKLSKDGRRLVVGEENSGGRLGVDSNIGQTRVFELNKAGDLWELVGQTIYGDRARNRAGKDVAISSDGEIIAIGMPVHGSLTKGDDLGVGAVRTYKIASDGVWKELGSGIFGVNEYERLGWSVALSDEGTTLVVGSRWNRVIDDSSQIETLKVGSFSAYEFDEEVKDWVQLGQPIFGVSFDDRFGTAVAVNADGSIVAGGADENDDADTDSGHIRVYQYNQDHDRWEQMGRTITGSRAKDLMAPVALSADGKRIAAGAPGSDGNTGYAKVYDYVDGDWVLVGADAIEGCSRGSETGFDVALSQDGHVLAVGGRGVVRIVELPKRLK